MSVTETLSRQVPFVTCSQLQLKSSANPTKPVWCDVFCFVLFCFYSSSEHGKYLWCFGPAPALHSVTTPHAGFIFCLFNLGINEISENVYVAVEPNDSWDSEKSDSSWNDSISDEEQRSKNEPEDAKDQEGAQMAKEPSAVKKRKKKKAQISKPSGDGRGAESTSPASE